VVEAPIRGVKSGRLFLSVGVGTAIIKISASRSFSISVVKTSCFAAAKSSSEDSRVESCPPSNSSTRA